MPKPTSSTPVDDQDASSDNEPAAGEATRSYLRIKPTDDALDPTTVQGQFRRLHQIAKADSATGLLDRFRSSTPPTVEFLLVAESNPHATLTYYVGIDDTDTLTELERVLRGVFPDAYEITHDEWSANQLASLEETDTEPAETETRFAGVEFQGRTDRRRDWQTQLTPFEAFTTTEEDDSHARVPLTAVVETMAERDIPMVYQALLRPKPAWHDQLEDRQLDIRMNTDSLGGHLANEVLGAPDPSDPELSASNEQRIAELSDKNARCSFTVNARAVAIGHPKSSTATEDPKDAARELASAFSNVSRTTYEIDGHVHIETDGAELFDAVRDRTFKPPNYERLATRVPWTSNTSPGIVADIAEAPNFCLLDGAALTTAASRALAPSRGEQTALPRPPEAELTPYRQSGFTLGRPLSQDDTPDNSIALPPDLQPLHIAWFGKTGSGKSTGLTTGMLDNHAATSGASILIDPKGDGMPTEYLRAHYAKYGALDDVYYFDCAETLPALSFFDIRPQLEAGIDRATAVQNTVDHYIELLMGIMGRDRFERAVRSPDIIRYLVKALFDPVHGSDAYTHRELQQAAAQMAETRDAPPVTDDDLEVMLGGVVTNSKRSFDELMQGVLNRIEKVPLDDRLAHLFNHVPETTAATADDNTDDSPPDPQFDFADVLNEDAVVIFDTSGLRTESRRALTLVLLSNLWTALQRRKRLQNKQRAHTGPDQQAASDGDLPLVNLYVEEAAEVAASGLMTDLLAQSRGFNLSVTLAMQFPAQVKNADAEAYDEILNNVSTIVTGNVAVDSELERRLATEAVPPSEVGNRLRSLRRGQWFASVPARFQDREPRPFLLSSAPLPPGHPEGEDPLTDTQTMAFEALVDTVADRTRLRHGLDFRRQGQAQTQADQSGASTPQTGSSSATPGTPGTRIDSTLPYTKRLPTCLAYDGAAHAIVCTGCDGRYAPSLAGVKRGIECCSSLDRVDRADVPVCEINLTLSAEEREASEYSDRQLAFLQAVYAAHQNEYDRDWEYDIRWDSMLRLQEYVGIESEAVDELVDDGLLRIDCDYPHRLYTVTAEGRDEIQVAHREGIAYGHGVGDLRESSLHRMMVAIGRCYVETAHADDSDSEVVDVVPYYELDDGSRLDVAGLDADGEVQVVVEAERVNHDVLRAVPEDYDKMVRHDPEEAIWIVKNRESAHDVLEALNDPPTGERRVEKTYSRSSPPQAFRLDDPGCSDIHTLRYVRDSLLELEPSS